MADRSGAVTEESTARPLDLRLVPAALGVWGATLLGLYCGWITAVALSCCGVATAGTGLVLVRRRWAAGVVMCSVLVATASFGVAVRLWPVENHPLREPTSRGESLRVRVELTERPTPTNGAGADGGARGERAVLRARLNAVRQDRRWHATSGAVLLLVPAESWSGLLRGQRVTTTGAALRPSGAGLLVTVLAVHQPPEDVTRPPPAQRFAERLRGGLRAASESVLSPRAEGLLPGLVVGDTSGLLDTVRRDFEKAGLTHLTAVSGANLAIVCGAVLLLFRAVRAPPVLAASAAGAALAGFVVLAGGEPSVLRAAVMGALGLLALALGRNKTTLPALAGCVILLVSWRPELAVSAGFALSVAATTALVLLAPPWSEWLRRRGLPLRLAQALVAPAAAQLATAPLVVALSGEFSLVGVLANLLVEPVIAPATVLGFAATLLAPWSAPLGELLVLGAAPELEWVLFVARCAVSVPLATLPLPSGMVGASLVVTLVLAVLVLLWFRGGRLLLGGSLLAVLLLVATIGVRPGGWPVTGWSVVACDVGQGDSLVLATGVSGSAVVVDTGPSAALVDGCLDRLGIRRVPLLVLTHPHADHFAGLAGVLVGREVNAVATGVTTPSRWADTGVGRRTREDGARLVRLSAGQRMRWPELAVEVLAPEGAGSEPPAERVNDASVVLRARTPVGRVLLTGDIELSGQRGLLSSGARLDAEVLKVPHHGSRYTSAEFLRAVSPRLALISVGHDNDHGHPSTEIIETLRGLGASVRRTDRRGDIAVLEGKTGMRTASTGDPFRPGD
ncbi:ComEC family competence protein [Actinopolyspora erythraea]|uniref:ComEC family competence protein n=1 Tax=Actinopolyspora erythraea TaxID=414996 RepID=A0A223RPX9_9ACTN|nr:ComEC/Rec2 family competence protein [Actinopolyspora erythraea]ASU77934.1 ComEC family competence protein [Actinopolyspora erythraea]